MDKEVEQLERKVLIKWLIMVLVGVLILLMPTNAIYTWQIKVFLAITICAILSIAFELTDPMVPAVLMPTAYYITGIVPSPVAFSGWTQPTGWMIIGAFLLANVLDESGLLKRIAYFCIKSMGGNFNGVLYGLYIAGCVLAFISVNSAYAIVVTLAFAICVALNLPPRSKSAAVVMMAGASGALTPGVFLYRPSWGGVISTAAQTIDENFVMLWQHFPLYNIPCFLLGLVFIFSLTKLFKTSQMNITGTKEYFVNEYNKLGQMHRREKKALFMVSILLLYVLTYPLHGKNIAYAFMVVPWLSFLPGIQIASKESIKRINIGTVFFVISCLTIATAGANVGIPDLISLIISPIAAQAGSLGLVFIVLIVGIISNLLLTPLAMITFLAPIVIQICNDMSISPWASLMTLIYSTDMYFLPHEVSALLLMFGFGMISMTDFFKIASLKTAIMFIGFCLIQIPWYIFMGALTL